MKNSYRKNRGARYPIVTGLSLWILFAGCASSGVTESVFGKKWFSGEKSGANASFLKSATAIIQPPAKEPALPYQQDLEFAKQRFHRQEYEAAEFYLRKTLIQAPENIQALRLLPWTYFFQRQYDQALLAFERDHSMSKKDPSPVTGMAWCYIGLNRYRQALDTFAQAEKLSGSFYEIQKGKALIYLKQKDMPRANEALQKIFTLNEIQSLLSFWQIFHENSDETSLPVVSEEPGLPSLFSLPVEHPRYRSILWKWNPPDSPDLEEAWRYYRNHFYRRALQAFQSLPQTVSLSLDARNGLAWSYLKNNKIQEAEEIFRDISQTHPRFIGAVKGVQEAFNLKMEKASFAQYYLDLGKWKIAGNKFAGLSEEFPGWAHPQIQLGTIELKQGNYDAARGYFQKALLLEPQDENALAAIEEIRKFVEPDLYAANRALKEGRYKEAARIYYDYLEERKPDDTLNESVAQAYSGLGWSQFQKGQYEKAIAKFRQAQKHADYKSDSDKGIGFSYFNLGRYSDAAVFLEMARDSQPGQRQIDYKLDWSILRGWETSRARSYFERELQNDPLRASLYMGLGWTHYRQNNPDLAVEFILKAISLDPESVLSDELFAFLENQRFGWQVYDKLGWAFFDKRSFAKSIEMFQASMQEQPRKSESLKGLGYNHYEMGDYETAVNYFKQALAVNPDPSGVMETIYSAKGEALFRIQTTVRSKLARAYYHLEDYRKAIEYYQQELALHPNQPDAYDGLGWVYLQLHRLTESRAAFTAALKLEPLNKGANKGLSQVKQLLATQNLRIKKPTFLPDSGQNSPAKS